MYNLKLIKTRKLKPLSQFNEMVTHWRGLKLKIILNIYDAASLRNKKEGITDKGQ